MLRCKDYLKPSLNDVWSTLNLQCIIIKGGTQTHDSKSPNFEGVKASWKKEEEKLNVMEEANREFETCVVLDGRNTLMWRVLKKNHSCNGYRYLTSKVIPGV